DREAAALQAAATRGAGWLRPALFEDADAAEDEIHEPQQQRAEDERRPQRPAARRGLARLDRKRGRRRPECAAGGRRDRLQQPLVRRLEAVLRRRVWRYAPRRRVRRGRAALLQRSHGQRLLRVDDDRRLVTAWSDLARRHLARPGGAGCDEKHRTQKIAIAGADVARLDGHADV